MQERKERGDYKTRAYFLIKEALLASGGEHLRADDIYTVLHAKGEHIGLTTVYRQLSRLCDEGFARKIATERMIEEAERLGADAIVAARFTTSSIMQSAAEIMVYGTAVKFR